MADQPTIPANAPILYYEDSSRHGESQYVSLKKIVDEIQMEALEDDSIIKNVKRYNIVRYAKNAIQEVTRSAANDIKAIEITVPPSLVWTLPQDYVNYVRVSSVQNDNGTYRLVPLDINYNISVATGYLQDHEYEILFDDQGEILTADSSNAYAFPYKKYVMPGCDYQPLLDTSRFSNNGEFTIDSRRGKILFSSEHSEKEVVLEYVSDGLDNDEENITVHKYLRETIDNWVYYACIERKRNVPANEKQRALLRYKTTLHKAKLAMSDFDLLRIAKAMRITTKAL